MAGMTAGMLTTAEGKKESGLMVAKVLEQPRVLVDGYWDACSSQGWRLMARMTAGMLAVAEWRKECKFSWLLKGLQQLRDVDFA
ncbi:hypothetical protein Pyn_07873 [Prunus yedoensis var. nudiflora]|uniref:Uncharacterized protein n=1 Tax=Prunus yedoensis var. nudiflora TaxID=2094558 RepID=A0A314UQ44_PRUYE|nr:hypothetical protein Pyn_07873 [Prunus yedoensis var. nudiflora]